MRRQARRLFYRFLSSVFLRIFHNRQVCQRAAVVSVGEGNQFGHPVDSVVERYARAEVRFLRTDLDGAVTAVTDGRELVVRSFVEEHPQ
jgi:beta-lactamase superfamily II metal-dependent hydrolase